MLMSKNNLKKKWKWKDKNTNTILKQIKKQVSRYVKSVRKYSYMGVYFSL